MGLAANRVLIISGKTDKEKRGKEAGSDTTRENKVMAGNVTFRQNRYLSNLVYSVSTSRLRSLPNDMHIISI